MSIDLDGALVDYLSLMTKRRDSSHLWHSHISFCRSHISDYYAGIERRNALKQRVSRMHKAYRRKKRSW